MGIAPTLPPTGGPWSARQPAEASRLIGFLVEGLARALPEPDPPAPAPALTVAAPPAPAPADGGRARLVLADALERTAARLRR